MRCRLARWTIAQREHGGPLTQSFVSPVRLLPTGNPRPHQVRLAHEIFQLPGLIRNARGSIEAQAHGVAPRSKGLVTNLAERTWLPVRPSHWDSLLRSGLRLSEAGFFSSGSEAVLL